MHDYLRAWVDLTPAEQPLLQSIEETPECSRRDSVVRGCRAYGFGSGLGVLISQ